MDKRNICICICLYILKAIKIMVSGSVVERMDKIFRINSKNIVDNFVKDEACL